MDAHAEFCLFDLFADETDNGMALHVAPPRTSQQKEPMLDEDAYLQPDPSNPDAILELENNKGNVRE